MSRNQTRQIAMLIGYAQTYSVPYSKDIYEAPFSLFYENDFFCEKIISWIFEHIAYAEQLNIIGQNVQSIYTKKDFTLDDFKHWLSKVSLEFLFKLLDAVFFALATEIEKSPSLECLHGQFSKLKEGFNSENIENDLYEFYLQSRRNKKFQHMLFQFIDALYVHYLIDGVQKNRAYLDTFISKYSKTRTVDRISRVDLSILRLAIFEMLFCKNTPSPVAINEAVNITKQYSSFDNSKFINGILGSVSRDETLTKK